MGNPRQPLRAGMAAANAMAQQNVHMPGWCLRSREHNLKALENHTANRLRIDYNTRVRPLMKAGSWTWRHPAPDSSVSQEPAQPLTDTAGGGQ